MTIIITILGSLLGSAVFWWVARFALNKITDITCKKIDSISVILEPKLKEMEEKGRRFTFTEGIVLKIMIWAAANMNNKSGIQKRRKVIKYAQKMIPDKYINDATVENIIDELWLACEKEIGEISELLNNDGLTS